MAIVDDLIELQVNYNLYHNAYCVAKATVAEHLKRTLEHLNILDLPVKSTSRIVDGIYRHPISIRLKMPATTDKNEIQRNMLLLRDKILKQHRKRVQSRVTRRLTKKKTKASTPIDEAYACAA